MWLTRCFRPDLSRATGILGSAVECWSDEHTEFLDALLGVVLHTKDAKMVMRYNVKDGVDDLRLGADSDSNLAVPKSTSGTFVAVVSDSGTFIPINELVFS